MAKSRHHPRIHPKNRPILSKYDRDHSAVRALQIQAEARDVCVGKEIEWRDIGNRAIEQFWQSEVRNKVQWFSSFAYEFISFDLILDNWLEMPNAPTQDELHFLESTAPMMRTLLNECDAAAALEGNSAVMPLINKAREFVDSMETTTHERLHQIGFSPDAEVAK